MRKGKITISIKNGKRVRRAVQNEKLKKNTQVQEEKINVIDTKENTENVIVDEEKKYIDEKPYKNIQRASSGNKTKRVIKAENKNLDKGISIVNKHKSKENKERKKRIGKTFNEVKEELEDEKYISVRTIVVAVIVIVIIILLYLLFEYGPIFGISINRGDSLNQKTIDIVSSDNDIYTMYNEELLIYSNQKVRTYNSNGKMTWEYDLAQMFIPSIYIEGKYMAIANNTNGNIYLFDNKKEILNKKIEGTIEHIYLDEKGNMAVEYSTSGYKKIVGVFDKNGKSICNTYLENDAIIDLKLLDNASKLLVIQTISNSFKIGTNINIIDCKSSEDNVKQVAKLDNNLVYNLTIQGSDIIMVLDDKLIKLNMQTNNIQTIKEFDNSQMLFISLSNNYYTSIEKGLNDDSNNYNINMVRFDGTIISNMAIQSSPKLLKTSGVLNYFLYQDRLKVVNKWGIEVKEQSLDISPKDIIIFNRQKSIALVYTNKIIVTNI